MTNIILPPSFPHFIPVLHTFFQDYPLYSFSASPNSLPKPISSKNLSTSSQKTPASKVINWIQGEIQNKEQRVAQDVSYLMACIKKKFYHFLIFILILGDWVEWVINLSSPKCFERSLRITRLNLKKMKEKDLFCS